MPRYGFGPSCGPLQSQMPSPSERARSTSVRMTSTTAAGVRREVVTSRLPLPEEDSRLHAERRSSDTARASTIGARGRCHHRRTMAPPINNAMRGCGNASAPSSHCCRA
eukprot:scaffold54513_cov31-Tisochrysis_lutea.AAC.3